MGPLVITAIIILVIVTIYISADITMKAINFNERQQHYTKAK